MKKPDNFIRKQFERTLLTQKTQVSARFKPLKNKNSNNSNSSEKLNCRVCQYFYVSWKKSTPYGCKAHGFVSAQIPSAVVFSSSGERCHFFKEK